MIFPYSAKHYLFLLGGKTNDFFRDFLCKPFVADFLESLQPCRNREANHVLLAQIQRLCNFLDFIDSGVGESDGDRSRRRSGLLRLSFFRHRGTIHCSNQLYNKFLDCRTVLYKVTVPWKIRMRLKSN